MIGFARVNRNLLASMLLLCVASAGFTASHIAISSPAGFTSRAQKLFVIVPIKNDGTNVAGDVRITGISFRKPGVLRPLPALQSQLPITLGDIADGGSTSFTAVFAGNARLGDKFALVVNGTYSQTPQGSRLPRSVVTFSTTGTVTVVSAVPKVTLFPNKADPLLMQVERDDGAIADYYATKDAAGLPLAIKEVDVQPSRGMSTSFVYGTNGQLQQVLDANGTSFSYQSQGSTVQVTAVSPDGSLRISVSVNTQTHLAGPASIVFTPQKPTGFVKPNRGPRHGAEAALSVRSQPLLGAAVPRAAGTSPSIVTVRHCESPVNDANVAMLLNFDVTGAWPSAVPGKLVADGTYSVSIPTPDPELGKHAKEVCEQTATILDYLCFGHEDLGTAGEEALCAQISTAVLALGPEAAPAAGLVMTACSAAVAARALLCDIFGSSGGLPPGAPSLLESLCGFVDSVVDRIQAGETLQLQPLARIPGVGSKYGDIRVVPAGGPFPSFSIEVGGSVAIQNFTASTFNPAPGEDYVATAHVVCAPPNTAVVMSIIGTDGYTDSKSYSITGDADVSLSVPGAAPGVVDHVTIKVGDSLSQTLVVYFG